MNNLIRNLMIIFAFSGAGCSTPSPSPLNNKNATVERDLKTVKPVTISPPAKGVHLLDFAPGNYEYLANPENDKVIANILASRPNNKSYLILTSYVNDDSFSDPAVLSLDRLRILINLLTNKGIKQEQIIPLASWSQTPKPFLPNNSIQATWLDKQQ